MAPKSESRTPIMTTAEYLVYSIGIERFVEKPMMIPNKIPIIAQIIF